jgi:oxygen-independent coproporphyrinogen-3 oxidase
MDNALRGEPLLESHEVARDDMGFEFMLNALRLTRGFPSALFAERTGFPLTLVQKGLEAAEQRGLIERDHLQIRPTLRGRRFLNDLQGLFLPPAGEAARVRTEPIVMARLEP